MSKPYIPNDVYARKAKEQDYRARSVFKLIELDKKYHLFKEGQQILDIAAAPGSWSQYASKIIGNNGTIIAIDLKPIDYIAKNVHTYVCDLNNTTQINAIIEKHGVKLFDLIISDIAPSTTGITEIDQGRSLELNKNIFELSKNYLKPEGTLILKVFEGKDFKSFVESLRKSFRKVEITKVKATRERSYEMYLVLQKITRDDIRD